MAISETVRKIEKIMEYRYENRRTANGIFLVIDRFAALGVTGTKKEFAEINDSLRRIILMGGSGQHSYYVAHLQGQRYVDGRLGIVSS